MTRKKADKERSAGIKSSRENSRELDFLFCFDFYIGLQTEGLHPFITGHFIPTSYISREIDTILLTKDINHHKAARIRCML